MKSWPAAAILAVGLTACTHTGAPPHAATSHASGQTECTARFVDGNPLPDPACTPGAINPDVTQAAIAATICATGWATTVRPPLAYTAAAKRADVRRYGYYAGTSLRRYEEDHLIPLSLGGAPRDRANLWPEAGPAPNPKDRVEAAARRAVCTHRMPLADAQHAIAADWVKLAATLGVRL